MSDVPKIVHDRLQAGAPGGPHPDADLLTAFAEQALSATERNHVLQHLARCSDCREAVALSLPPLAVAAGPDRAGEAVDAAAVAAGHRGSRNWFAWPNLRWAALAAGVVVVASVLVLRPGKHSMVETVNQQAETASPAITATAQPEPLARTKSAPLFAGKMDSPKRRESTKPNTKPGMREDSSRLEAQESSRGSVSALADNKRTDSLDFDKRALPAAAPPVAEAKAGNAVGGVVAPSKDAMVSNETVTVTAAAPLETDLMARSQAPAPIEKAKPAAKEEARKKSQLADNEAQKQLAATYSASGSKAFALKKAQSKDVAAQWSFAQGLLRRSLDGGATWQTALQLEHPLLSFGARGSDVWAGGQAGVLFHSTDSGTTWTQVQPSTKAGSLSADIVAIEIRSSAEVVLSTSNNESWTTADGGKTWEKK